MGGVRVDADTQMSTLAGLFAAGECASGINGANRLGGNSLSDLLVFGKRAGEHAARFARGNGSGRIDPKAVSGIARRTLAPFEPGPGSGEDPYRIQHELQRMMQSLVGIVRNEPEMRRALDGLRTLGERARRARVPGNREYNPGWHTALDLGNLLTISEAITRSALERRESRGAHFREDFPDKDPALGRVNLAVRRGADGEMKMERVPIADMPAELARVVEEMS